MIISMIMLSSTMSYGSSDDNNSDHTTPTPDFDDGEHENKFESIDINDNV